MPNGFLLGSTALWMSWNLFLATIPYILSRYLFKPKQKISLVWLAAFALFILFMPNAPYVITDIMHLFYNPAAREYEPVFAVFLFFSFELVGIWLFVKSYHNFEQFFVKRVKVAKEPFRFFWFVILSLGVYLGRFPRLNSWDILRPARLIEGFTEAFSLHGFTYISLFTILLWLVYFLYERLK